MPTETNAASQLHWCGYRRGAARVMDPASLARNAEAARAASSAPRTWTTSVPAPGNGRSWTAVTRGTDSCPSGERAAGEQAVADDPPLDLAGPLEDRGQPGVAPVPLDLPLGGVAVAAVQLHGLVGDPHGHLGGLELDHRGLLLARHAQVQQVGDLPVEGPRLLDLRGHVGDGEPQRLEVADRVAELLALLQVEDRVLERRPGQADRPRGGVHARGVEELLRLGEPRPLRRLPLLVAVLPRRPGLVENVVLGDAHAVEGQIPGEEAVVADLVDRVAAQPLGELAALLLQQQVDQALGP